MNITIVGLGLIGGSMAIALKNAGFASHVIGVDNNPEHCKIAMKKGLVHEVSDLQESCAKADLIIVAIPVDKSKEVVARILDLIDEHTVVTDMGSTKKMICKHLEKHAKRHLYVAAHPIAGTEHSGPLATQRDLFNNKKTFICEKNKSSNKALTTVLKMFHCLNMSVEFMEAEEHDKHVAYISHLSHITSFALGLTVLDIEKDEKSICDMAGSGFFSTVRLAMSSPEMWTPILIENKENISYALNKYVNHLQKFKDYIDQTDKTKMFKMLKKANDIRRILDDIIS